MNGFIIVNKPTGLTSHDVVAHLRRLTGQRRVGHAGTLDPLATGVLVIATGTATRLNEYLLESAKQYRATIKLGQATPSYDSQTPITHTHPVTATQANIEAILSHFRGNIMQIPPAYSAIKRSGERSYTRARRGEEVQLDPRPVTIYHLDLLTWDSPTATLDVTCSKGTYIRSLAHDIGQALGCGAHLTALERTKAGPFTLDQSHTLDQLDTLFANGQGQTALLPPIAALASWPVIQLTEAYTQDLRHGRVIPRTDPTTERAAACLPDGTLIAIVIANPEQNTWQPKKVFA